MMKYNNNNRLYMPGQEDGIPENLADLLPRRTVLKGLAATGLAMATGALLGGCQNPRGYFHNYRLFVVTKKEDKGSDQSDIERIASQDGNPDAYQPKTARGAVRGAVSYIPRKVARDNIDDSAYEYQMLGFVDTNKENDAFNYLVDHRNEVMKLVDSYTDPDTTIRFVQTLYVQRNVEAAGQILYEALENNPNATKPLQELGVAVEEEIDVWAVASVIATAASMGLGAFVGPTSAVGLPPVTVSIQK